jgi:hypothetical protein
MNLAIEPGYQKQIVKQAIILVLSLCAWGWSVWAVTSFITIIKVIPTRVRHIALADKHRAGHD